MDKIIGIKCNCESNLDINGSWDRKSLEDECEYLGQPREDWLSYLFGHLFADYNGWNTEIEDAFANNESLVSMTVKLDCGIATITKLYM